MACANYRFQIAHDAIESRFGSCPLLLAYSARQALVKSDFESDFQAHGCAQFGLDVQFGNVDAD